MGGSSLFFIPAPKTVESDELEDVCVLPAVWRFTIWFNSSGAERFFIPSLSSSKFISRHTQPCSEHFLSLAPAARAKERERTHRRRPVSIRQQQQQQHAVPSSSLIIITCDFVMQCIARNRSVEHRARRSITLEVELRNQRHLVIQTTARNVEVQMKVLREQQVARRNPLREKTKRTHTLLDTMVASQKGWQRHREGGRETESKKAPGRRANTRPG